MNNKFTCPRRSEALAFGGTLMGTDLNKDSYEPGSGLVSQRRGCTYCGSMDPDDFMEAIREGFEVVPTDKSYKAYLNSGDGGATGKFYFQHLSPEQRTEFARMFNAGEMKVGYPGYFYVRPFFAVPADPA